jgi:outer membrane lipoprotein SlyB
MKRSFAASAALMTLLAATAGWARGWTPVVDTYGSSRAQYLGRDLEECRMLANQAGGDSVGQGARGAVRGGLVGAAGGAAIGAALGNAGRGAAVGAAAGGVTRGVGAANQSDAQFRQAYSNCMRARGHRVLN